MPNLERVMFNSRILLLSVVCMLSACAPSNPAVIHVGYIVPEDAEGDLSLDPEGGLYTFLSIDVSSILFPGGNQHFSPGAPTIVWAAVESQLISTQFSTGTTNPIQQQCQSIIWEQAEVTLLYPNLAPLEGGGDAFTQNPYVVAAGGLVHPSTDGMGSRGTVTMELIPPQYQSVLEAHWQAWSSLGSFVSITAKVELVGRRNCGGQIRSTAHYIPIYLYNTAVGGTAPTIPGTGGDDAGVADAGM